MVRANPIYVPTLTCNAFDVPALMCLKYKGVCTGTLACYGHPTVQSLRDVCVCVFVCVCECVCVCVCVSVYVYVCGLYGSVCVCRDALCSVLCKSLT
jgi:hypothetical protein